MELLNLDDISPATRKVSLNGVEYKVAKRTVGEFILAIKAAKEEKNRTQEENLLIFIELARKVIPDAPEEVVNGLTFDQLNALMNFANKSDSELVAAELASSEGEGTSAKKSQKTK